MRRLQISIEPELDDELSAESARTGKSKAALLREYAWSRLGTRVRRGGDPIDALVGAFSFEPADHNTIYD